MREGEMGYVPDSAVLEGGRVAGEHEINADAEEMERLATEVSPGAESLPEGADVELDSKSAKELEDEMNEAAREVK